MTKIEGDQWLFIWNNITSYPNEATYNFQVTAKDSSSNENVGISGIVIIYLEVYFSSNPGLINGILYILVASLLIAGVMVYFNKKRASIPHRRE